nr:GntR family transcriptional regulator [Maliibacterium massiliense]
METKTTAQRAYEAIKEMYLTRKLMPGQQIVEAVIAAELGISRTPVREAIRRLQEEGLVETIMNRGSFIKAITREDVIEYTELSEGIDGMIAYLLAERYGEGELREETVRELEDMIAQMEQFFAQGRVRDVVNCDRAMHMRMADLCGNRHLRDTFCRAAENFYNDMWFLTLSIESKQVPQQDNHRALIDAIRRADPEGARSIAQRHRHYLRQAIKESE